MLDGRVEVTGQSGAPDTRSAPAPLAFEEILEGHPMRVTVRALEPTICLSIGTEAFLSLLAENVELAEGIMRWLIEGHAALSTPVMLKGDLAPEVQRKVAAGLQAVDRVLLLQSSPLLKGATGTQLLRLASPRATSRSRLASIRWRTRSDRRCWSCSPGTLAVTTPDGRTESADSGDVIGMFQTLGGKPLGATVSATTDGTACASPAPTCSRCSRTRRRCSSRCSRACCTRRPEAPLKVQPASPA